MNEPAKCPSPSAQDMAVTILSTLGRNRANDLIEALLARMDALDGDPDTEEDDEDRCGAADDTGMSCGGNDGLPGDPVDTEDGHDVEHAERGYCDDQRLVRYARGGMALNVDTMRDQAVQL